MTTRTAQAPATKVTTKSSTMSNPAGMTKSSSSTSTSTRMKADGTPDLRYKENKMTKTTTGPKKADGTADLRYKANKTTVKTTKSKM